MDDDEDGEMVSAPGGRTYTISDVDALEKATRSTRTDIAIDRLKQVSEALWLPPGRSTEEFLAHCDSVLYALADIQPRDAVEQMLASQMIACHEAAMECARRAMIPDQLFEGRDNNLKHFEKLSATYARLMETLDKHRGKGQQKVTVEHVNVAPGGQAIVGSVETGGGSRPGTEKPALENAPELPMQAVGAPRSNVAAARKRKGENARNS